MKRKRIFLLTAAIVLCWMMAGLGHAQAPGMGPVTSGVCCREGVPSVPADHPCELLHQVGPGENLHVLAAYYYGDARAWRRIYELNKKQIRNPNKIMVGQVLRIEVPPCWSPRFPLEEFLRIEQRRKELLSHAPGERPREIRKTEVVETTVTVSFEEEEKPAEEGAKPEAGQPPATQTITIEESGGEQQ